MTILSIHTGPIEALPEEVGYNGAKIELLNTHFTKLIDAGKLQGASYLLAKNGKIFAQQALGHLRHTENSPPLLTTSIRQIYSISKVFIATAIMQLIERGMIYLHQPVSMILSEFNNDTYKDISIFHLLTHTSGIKGDPGFFLEPHPLPSYDIAAHHAKGHNLNWIQTILLGLPDNKPNKEYIYCTAGFKLLAEIVSRVTGKDFDRYMQEEILNPLGMNRSYFDLPTYLHEEALVVNDWQLQHLSYVQEEDSTNIPRMGRGLYSTLEDLNKFAQMMLSMGEYNGHRLLTPKSIQLQTRNQLNNIESYGWGTYTKEFKYGLGWNIDHFDLSSVGSYSHEGFGHCGMFIDPIEQFVFIFFVPAEDGYIEEAVVNSRAIAWSGII